MNQDIKEKTISSLSLIAVCVWPFLNIFCQNKHIIFKITPFLSNAIFLSVIMLSLAYLLQMIFRTTLVRFNSVLCVLLICMFSYGAIADIIPSNPTFLGVRILIPFTLMWAIIVTFLCLLIWYKSKSPILRQFVMIISFLLAFIPFAQSVYSASVGKFGQKAFHNINSSEKITDLTFKKKNNVYFLLIDAYGRDDTLKSHMNFYNEPFLKELSEKEFFIVRNSYSNYHFTLASLSSIFNMDYHIIPEGGIDQRIAFNLPLRGYNRVVDIFKANGYKYILAPSNRWTEIDCGGTEDMCIAPYANAEVMQKVIELTPFRKIIYKIRKPNYMDFTDLQAAITAFPNHPKFIFAHFAQVHDTIYDADCSIKKLGNPIMCCSDTIKDYTNSVNCMNRKLLKFIDEVLSVDREAIIIVQGDHGPTIVAKDDEKACQFWLNNFWDWRIKSQEDFRNMYGVLSVVRIPPSFKQEFLYESISPVNIFRAVFAHLQETKPSYIKDRSFLLYEDKHNKGIYWGDDDLDKFRNLSKSRSK